MKQRILARERQRIADLEEALIGVLGELAELVVDEKCDHGVNICWCGVVSLIVGAASLIEGRCPEAVERIVDRFPPPAPERRAMDAALDFAAKERGLGPFAAPFPPGAAARWEVVLVNLGGAQKRLHVEADDEDGAITAALALMQAPTQWRAASVQPFAKEE